MPSSVATNPMLKRASAVHGAFAFGDDRARVGVSVCTWIVDAPP